MTPPAPVSSAGLENLWNRIVSVLGGEAPLPSRIAEAAVAAMGAREATLYVRERDAWVRTGEKLGGSVQPGEIPEPLPDGLFVREGELWLPLASEGEIHGLLRVLDAPSDPPREQAAPGPGQQPLSAAGRRHTPPPARDSDWRSPCRDAPAH